MPCPWFSSPCSPHARQERNSTDRALLEAPTPRCNPRRHHADGRQSTTRESVSAGDDLRGPDPGPSDVEPTRAPGGCGRRDPLDPSVAPFGVISDGHALWITAHRGTTVYKIDPTSNQVIARVDIGQEACGLPAFAFTRLWVNPCDDGVKVVAIDVATNAVVASLPDPLHLGASFGSDAIWATSPDRGASDVERIDPVTLKPTLTSPARRPYGYLEVGGTLWAMDASVAQLDQLDPATGELLGSVVLPLPEDDSLYFMATDGGIWVEGYQTGDIVRVDVATHDVKSYTVPGYSHPTGYYDTPLTAALGSLWMRTSDWSVARLDPGTGLVTATYPADTGGGAVTVAFGSLWVANFDNDTIWRERLTP